MECTRTIEQICLELGEDIDSPLCQEIRKHLDDCPECCANVDSIKKTVFIYRKVITNKNVPEDVDTRLWKVLNLQKPCTAAK